MAGYIAGQGRNAWGETHPVRDARQDRLHHPPPGRRRRDDHAVELPGRDPVVEDLPRAARRQRRRHQAVGARAAVLRRVRAGVPRRRRARRAWSTSCTASARSARRSSSHPGIRAVSFTGSVPTGRLVASAAMATGPRLVSLELGGKNAMVVHARRRPRSRRRRRAVRRVRHRGPALHLDVAARRAPRRRRRARRRARGARREARARRPGRAGHRRRSGDRRAARPSASPAWSTPRSARATSSSPAAHIVAVDGCEGGAFFEPTILRGATRDSYIARNEVFGPVLSVHRDRFVRRGHRHRQRLASTGSRPRSTRATSTTRCGPCTRSTPASST